MTPDSKARPTPAPLCPLDRSGMPGTSGIILHIFVAIAAAMVGIGICAMRTTSPAEVQIAEGVSIAVMLLLAVYLWRVSRSAKGILPLLVCTCIFLAYLTESAIPSAVLAGFLFAVGEGSVLLAVQPKSRLTWFPLIPMAAYAVTALVSRDLVGSLASLVPFPPMLVLALATRSSAGREDGLTRVGVICATSLTMGVSLGAMILLSVYRLLGTLEPAALLEAVEAARLYLIESISSAEIPEGLNEETLAEVKEMLSYANVENLVNSAFNLLPACFVVAVNLMATVAQSIQHASLRAFGFEKSISARVTAFRMSLVSCLIFFAAYVVALLEGTDTSTLAGTVAQNVYIILMPGLALAGLLRITSGLVRKGARGMGCLFFLVILIPCLFLLAPFVFAAFEVIGHVFEVITSALKPPDDDDFPTAPPSDRD